MPIACIHSPFGIILPLLMVGGGPFGFGFLDSGPPVRAPQRLILALDNLDRVVNGSNRGALNYEWENLERASVALRDAAKTGDYELMHRAAENARISAEKLHVAALSAGSAAAEVQRQLAEVR